MNLEAYMGERPLKRKVYLHGYLGELFGKEFDLAVRSPAEAIRLLEANFPRKFQDAVKKGVFQVIVSGAKAGIQCSIEMIHFAFPKGSIHFIPIPEGSSGGGGKSKGIMLAIIGVALIATAFVGAAFFAGAAGIGAGLGTAAFAGITWGQIGLLGAALLLLGVSILLTPTPKPDAGKIEQIGSFFYSGAVNSEREGGPVPIVYGRVFAGSIIVAGGIFDDKFAITNAPVVYPSMTQDGEGVVWIAEGGNPNGIDDNPNTIIQDETPTGPFLVVHNRTDPPAPVGGVKFQ